MEEQFRKDLTHPTWVDVYARQEKRAHLVDASMDALCLKPGDRVLEVGAGPGYVSMALAARVGREGMVYAVDKLTEPWSFWSAFRKNIQRHKSSEALRLLQRSGP